jgi:hypothetical protein
MIHRPPSAEAQMAKRKPKPADQLTDHERDDLIAADIVTENHAEARKWLGNPGQLMIRGEHGEALPLVNAFYKAGATRVDVGEIVQDTAGDSYANVLVVTLPKGKAARTAVIHVAAAHNFSGVRKPEKVLKQFGFFDFGQKFLIVGFL